MGVKLVLSLYRKAIDRGCLDVRERKQQKAQGNCTIRNLVFTLQSKSNQGGSEGQAMYHAWER
jgi:hypothetical protein